MVVDAIVDVAGRGEGHLRVVEGERAVVVDDARRPGVTITGDGRRAEGRRQVERHVVEGEAGALVAILGDVDAVVVRRDGVVVALDRNVGAMDAKALLSTRAAEKFDRVAILRSGKRVVEAAIGRLADLCDGLGGGGATAVTAGGSTTLTGSLLSTTAASIGWTSSARATVGARAPRDATNPAATTAMATLEWIFLMTGSYRRNGYRWTPAHVVPSLRLEAGMAGTLSLPAYCQLWSNCREYAI